MPIVVCVFLAHKYRRSKVPFDYVEKFLRGQKALAPTRYSYTEIIGITRNFKEKVGEGGFGSVFKGTIMNNRFVAVKMLGDSKLHGDEEIINEVSTLGLIHHKNIVQLVGFCSEGVKKALVYEYMPNGSLEKHIFSTDKNRHARPFTWEKLNEIALGVSRGIDYLHRECDMQILHFDIKPHNVLLDHNFVPKISDFGLAKLYPKDFSLVSVSIAKGTTGYVAPEVISRNFGAISHKSDVYSFGMMLLEMSGGKRNWNIKQDERKGLTSSLQSQSFVTFRATESQFQKFMGIIELSLRGEKGREKGRVTEERTRLELGFKAQVLHLGLLEVIPHRDLGFCELREINFAIGESARERLLEGSYSYCRGPWEGMAKKDHGKEW
ncbi:hypothetical protein LUZ60_012784 [Juncus effusus]|nr:hypothetical protein LUZ60_012784 [Juncus effusus]